MLWLYSYLRYVIFNWSLYGDSKKNERISIDFCEQFQDVLFITFVPFEHSQDSICYLCFFVRKSVSVYELLR